MTSLRTDDDRRKLQLQKRRTFPGGTHPREAELRGIIRDLLQAPLGGIYLFQASPNRGEIARPGSPTQTVSPLFVSPPRPRRASPANLCRHESIPTRHERAPLQTHKREEAAASANTNRSEQTHGMAGNIGMPRNIGMPQPGAPTSRDIKTTHRPSVFANSDAALTVQTVQYNPQKRRYDTEPPSPTLSESSDMSYWEYPHNWK